MNPDRNRGYRQRQAQHRSHGNVNQQAGGGAAAGFHGEPSQQQQQQNISPDDDFDSSSLPHPFASSSFAADPAFQSARGVDHVGPATHMHVGMQDMHAAQAPASDLLQSYFVSQPPGINPDPLNPPSQLHTPAAMAVPSAINALQLPTPWPPPDLRLGTDGASSSMHVGASTGMRAPFWRHTSPQGAARDLRSMASLPPHMHDMHVRVGRDRSSHTVPTSPRHSHQQQQQQQVTGHQGLSNPGLSIPGGAPSNPNPNPNSPRGYLHRDFSRGSTPPNIDPRPIQYPYRYDADTMQPPVAVNPQFCTPHGAHTEPFTSSNVNSNIDSNTRQTSATLMPNWCVVTGLPRATLPPAVRPDSPVSIMHLLPWALSLRKFLRGGALAVVLDPTVRQVRGQSEQPTLMMTVTQCGDSQAVVSGITHQDMYIGRQNLPEAWRVPEHWKGDMTQLQLGDLNGVRLVLSHGGFSLLCKPCESTFLAIQSALTILRQTPSENLAGTGEAYGATLLSAVIRTCIENLRQLGVTQQDLLPSPGSAFSNLNSNPNPQPTGHPFEPAGLAGSTLRGTCLQRLNHSKQKLALSIEWDDWQRSDLRWVCTLIVNGRPVTRGDACWKKQDSRENAARLFFNHLDSSAAGAAGSSGGGGGGF